MPVLSDAGVPKQVNAIWHERFRWDRAERMMVDLKKLYPMGVIALIFVIGLGFILYPSIGNYITLNTASVTIADYEQVIEKLEPDATERLEEARLFNEHLFHGTAEEDEDKCLNVNDNVICYLDIPKIDVYLPVYYGTSAEVLEKGCGYIENTSLPVGGINTNSAMSGHTGLPGAELLSSLDEMEKEDLFYIHVLGDTLAYKVDMIEVVEPEQAEDLEIVPGKDYVTLVTCTPYGINSHRLLVRGERTEYTPEEEELHTGSAGVTSGLSASMVRQLLVIAGIAGFGVLTLGAALIYRRIALRGYRKKSGKRAGKDAGSKSADGGTEKESD